MGLDLCLRQVSRIQVCGDGAGTGRRSHAGAGQVQCHAAGAAEAGLSGGALGLRAAGCVAQWVRLGAREPGHCRTVGSRAFAELAGQKETRCPAVPWTD